MSTPHNQAEPGQIARIVLMPGDPLRARYIAEKYLENPVCFNEVRGMYGYTGTYQGQEISVMGSGMGMPSIGIYSWELYSLYGVEAIIRIGSAGGYTEKDHVFDILLADSCWSQSTYARTASHDACEIQMPSPELNGVIERTAKRLGMDLEKGRLHSSDVFYCEDDSSRNDAVAHDCRAVEMESFALFSNAKVLHKQAACLITISDSFVYEENATAGQRERNLNTMIELALASAAAWQEETR